LESLFSIENFIAVIAYWTRGEIHDKKFMTRNLYTEITSAVLILLFAYTASSKTIDHAGFENVLFMTIPGHRKGASAIAWLIPVAEYIVVLLLLFQQTRMKGLYLSLLLLGFFTFYLGYMILFKKGLPCSCGGVISKMSWPQHIIFNLFLIAINIAGIVFYKRKVPAKLIT